MQKKKKKSKLSHTKLLPCPLTLTWLSLENYGYFFSHLTDNLVLQMQSLPFAVVM